MSLMETFHDHSGLPGSILTVLVALLLLLAGIIWVAFCIALYRAAQRVAEIKRQRRRQHIIAAALNRAVNQPTIPSVQAGISLSFPSANTNDLSPNDLPSYEEAIQVPPPPEWNKTMTSRRLPSHDSLRAFHHSGLLRVAPERPGNIVLTRNREDAASTTSRDPPSYETAIRCLEIETEL